MEILTIAKRKEQVIKPLLSQGASVRPSGIKDFHKVRSRTINIIVKRIISGK